MLKRPAFILGAAIVAVIGACLYFANRAPAGVAPQSDGAETIAWIGLGTSIVGLFTAIVGLLGRILEVRSKR